MGFSLIFVGTLVAGAVITWLVTRFMKRAKLQWADRLLGAAFGFIRGWMIGAVVLLVLTAFDVQTERIKNSAACAVLPSRLESDCCHHAL